jgi:hypothetical protein
VLLGSAPWPTFGSTAAWLAVELSAGVFSSAGGLAAVLLGSAPWPTFGSTAAWLTVNSDKKNNRVICCTALRLWCCDAMAVGKAAGLTVELTVIYIVLLIYGNPVTHAHITHIG